MNIFTVFLFVLSVYASDCVLQSSHSKVGDNHIIIDDDDDYSTNLQENDMSMSQCTTEDEHLSQSNVCAQPKIQYMYIPKDPCSKYPHGIKHRKEFEKSVKANLIDTGYMDNYDLRIKNLTCPSITEISDQGGCSSCWAVAATDVMTDRLCLQSNGTNTARYSVVDLLSCCKNCLKNQIKPCEEGGTVRFAWSHWTSIGIVSGHYNKTGKRGCRNYHVKPCTHDFTKVRNEKTNKCMVPTMNCPSVDDDDQPTCSNLDEQKCDAAWDGRSYKEDLMQGKVSYCMTRQFVGHEAAIKLEILLNGPVHLFMSVYPDFYTMFTPNYDNFDKVEPYFHKYDEIDYCPGHSIRIVGWGKKGNRSYWIAANSYGEKWGDHGFFHLDFNHDSDIQKGKEMVYAGIPNLI